ncbi:MAG TPA: metallopeptidase TldD-related protein [Terriglobales bacterium]
MLRPRFLFYRPVSFLILILAIVAAAAENDTNSALLATAEHELKRAHANLGKLDPAAYFISYTIRDQSSAVVIASQGSLLSSTQVQTRTADVVTRVGSPALDNTHGESRRSALRSGNLPTDNDADAIAHALWDLTYRGYREALQAFLKVKTQTQVNAKEEDTSADFTPQTPSAYLETKELPPPADQHALETMVAKYSAAFRGYPYIYSSSVLLTAQTTRTYFVSTEGSQVVSNSAIVRVAIQAETRADDGMELIRVETFQTAVPSQLPPESEVLARIEKMAADLKALRAAPVAEPFNGPALLSGRAAAVFFHEVLGHRLEGQRQRGEKEAQTFTKRINQPVLPDFLTVVDDPTQQTLNGTELSGWYQYDDEGVPATRVEVIQNGILKNFLMSRMPIQGFDKSNGHGRAQFGLMPVGRQGNLIVISTNTVSDAELRQRFIAEIKKQGKPYGLYFEDIEGGFTLTQRAAPQSFQVLPILVWRVYADGRPDELVRGVDIVGTPLAAMNRILVTGQKTGVFNGICGAESGNVPVSAASPAILFAEMEVQKRPHTLDRPPLLPPPGGEAAPPAGSPKGGQQ